MCDVRQDVALRFAKDAAVEAVYTDPERMLREAGARVSELQQLLVLDDCYLPRIPQEFSALTVGARLEASNGADPERVRDGWNRPIGDDPHAWTARPGDSIAYLLDAPAHVAEAKLLLDTAMDRDLALSLHYRDHGMTHTPEETPRRFRIDVMQGGEWRELRAVEGNYQRQVRVAVGEVVEGVRYTLTETHGAEASRVYAFYVR